MLKSLVAALPLALLSQPAVSQSTDGLSVQSLKTYAYASMVNWTERDSRPAGIEEIAQVSGMVFLDIRAVFDVPWSDDLSRLSISARDIVVILPDGTEVQSCCSYEYWGMMHQQGSSASVSRPNDWPVEDRDLYWHSIFLVPEGTAEVTLRLPADEGEPGYEGPVTVPGAVVDEPDAALFAEFSASDAVLLPMLELSSGRETTQVTSTIAAPEGQMFADIEIEVLGLSANEFEGDGRFYWHTYDFRLVDVDGATLPLIGERFQDRLLDSQFNSAGIGDTSSRRMVFMVPQGLTAATLLFGSTPVAEVAF